MPAQFLALTVAAGGVWATVFLLALLVIARARRARRDMLDKTRELASRAEQLRLVNRASFLMARHSRRRGLARAVTDFLVREMGAAAAVFWRPDSEGEPEAPWLGRYAQGQAPEMLPEAHRIILARTAARGSAPLALCPRSGDRRPQPLRIDDPPQQPFTLFIPLASRQREGVLEVYSGADPWERERWELVPTLSAELGAALERARQYEEARRRADVDLLTGLFNHRYMQVYLEELVGAQPVRRSGFAVLLLDVDGFKSFNDTHGHSQGDRVLQVLASQLKLMTDRVGMVGRFGGDEFIVVLPGHSGEDGQAFAQAFQDWLTNYTFRTPAGQTVPIAVSWGIAACPQDGGRRQELLAAAEARLHEQKAAGSEPAQAASGLSDDGEPGAFGLLDSLVTSVDGRDHYTRAHCEATAEYAVMLAREVGLPPAEQRTLRLAALLHDVGKVCIPDSILRKPGPLSEEESALMRHHVSMAEELIVDVPAADEVRRIARHHHERYDGSGYPDGLRGEEIPYPARVLALADAFAAITLDRPYRKGLSSEAALEELKRVAGAQLDPELVKAFGRALNRPADGSRLSISRRSG